MYLLAVCLGYGLLFVLHAPPFIFFIFFLSAVMSIMHISEDKHFLTVVGVLWDA